VIVKRDMTKKTIRLLNSLFLAAFGLPVLLILLTLDTVDCLGEKAYDVSEKVDNLGVKGCVILSIFAWGILVIILWWAL